MSRAAITNLILFFIVIILSLLAWYQPGLYEARITRLSTIDKQDIKHIRIERKQLETIQLQKFNDLWFMEQPYFLPANSLRIDTVLALTNKRSYHQFIVNKMQLDQYKLEQPSLSVWFDQAQFTFGSTDPIKRQRYTMNITENNQADKNTIHLIDGIIYFQLRSAIDTFIAPKLLPEQARIKRIRWLDNELVLDKNWKLTPEQPNISSDSIAQLIQFWHQARAEKVQTKLALDFKAYTQVQIQEKSIIITVSYQLGDQIKTEDIQYLIIQDDEQLKLVRMDMQIAYWISPQTLKMITEFHSVQKTDN